MPTIRKIDIHGVAVPLVEAFKTSHGMATTQRSVVVRVHAGDGAVGVGNVDPSPGYSTETVEQDLEALRTILAPVLIGADPTNIRRLMATMDAALDGFFEAKAALEMACVDLAARLMGVPVHTYLGGAVKERCGFNAWIGMLSPDVAAAEARKWQSAGFRSAKVKVGGDVASDAARVHAVRAAVGRDFKIRVDANAGYDTKAAIELVGLIATADLELFEQPGDPDDLAGMAAVRRVANKAGIPIMADESVTDHASLIALIKQDAADLVKVKVMKQGGFLKTAQMIATAEAAGISCVIGHGFGLGVNTVAEIMLAATARNVIDGIECVGPLKTTDDIVTRRIDLSRGSLTIPAGPGLGVALDDTKITQYRFAEATVT